MTVSDNVQLKLIAQLTGHEDRVWQAQWNPVSSTLASCSADRTFRLYSYVKNEDGIQFNLLSTIATGHRRTVRSIAWSPSGETLATASFDSTIGIWQRAEGDEPGIKGDWECVSTIEGHENECKCVAYSSTGTLLATCGRDKSVWVWEVQPDSEFDCLSVLMEHTQDVKSIAWHPTLEILASASYDNTVKLYLDDPSDDWYAFATLKGHTSTVWGVTFSPCGKYLASSSDDESIIIWKGEDISGSNGGTWKDVCRLSGHAGPIYSLSWIASPKRQPKTRTSIGWLASAGGDGKINVWDVTVSEDKPPVEGTLVTSLELAHDTDINHVTWRKISDDLLLATAGDDGLVKIWEVRW